MMETALTTDPCWPVTAGPEQGVELPLIYISFEVFHVYKPFFYFYALAFNDRLL